MVVLSKEKAAHKQNWEKIVKVFQEGGLVRGKVKAVVKGGLTVNVGVEAFLPGSQVDIIPPKDLNEYVGNVYEFKIVKVNDERKNIVLSRREVIEAERSELRQTFLQSVKIGDKVTGAIKNITDFGAFVDLQGMDGLLHITAMSWAASTILPNSSTLANPSMSSSSTWTRKKSAFPSASSRCPTIHGKTSSANTPSASMSKAA
jgi:small subunit ribosomal protein S1